MATTYARLLNNYKFIHQVVFSARFDEQDEDDQVIDEVELYINLNNYRNSTESDIDNIDFKSQLQQEIQNQETKNSG